MSYRFTLNSAFARQRAATVIQNAPDGYVAEENWREIASHPDYAVSDQGRVKRVRPGGQGRMGKGPLRPLTVNGYLRVSLCDGCTVRNYSIHRLVCEAFHGPAPSPGHHAAHADGDKSNNRATNLRWATPAENCADKIRHGTIATGSRHGSQTKPEKLPRGERHGNTSLTAEIVRAIRADGRTHKAIAAELGISRPTVTAIKARRNWAHVE